MAYKPPPARPFRSSPLKHLESIRESANQELPHSLVASEGAGGLAYATNLYSLLFVVFVCACVCVFFFLYSTFPVLRHIVQACGGLVFNSHRRPI